MPSFLVLAALWLVTFVIGELLRPKAKHEDQKPGTFEPPDASEGDAIPVVFGTCKVSANVTWFGHVLAKAKKKTYRTGFLGLNKDSVVVGYEYGAGLQMSICHGPVDKLTDMLFGEESLIQARSVGFFTTGLSPLTTPKFPLNQTVDKTAIDIHAPGLFGGEERDGGVVGVVDFYFGTEEQGQNDYLATHIGADKVSNYRGLCHAVFRQVVMGESPYLKPVFFAVQRCPKRLTGELTGVGTPWLVREVKFSNTENPYTWDFFNIDFNWNGDPYFDANPAEVVYEILVDKRWGLAVPESFIDTASFRQVALKLAGEGRGISMVMRTQRSAHETIQEVLRHVDGVMYTHPDTGLISLRLVRADYDVLRLPRFDAATLAELEFTRGSWQETVNDVKVTYVNRLQKFTDSVAQAQNLAAFYVTGAAMVGTYDYSFFTNPTNAQWAADRLMRSLSVPLAKARFTTNRKGGRLVVGSAFILERPEHGIDELVMRVARIDYGTLADGAMIVDAVEDVFDMTGVGAGYQPGTGGGVGNDWAPAEPLFAQRLMEIPYHFSQEDRRVAILAMRSNALTIAYEVWAGENGAALTERETFVEFTPTALLSTSAPEEWYTTATPALDPTGFTVIAFADAGGLEKWAPLLVLLNDEIMEVGRIENLGFGFFGFRDVKRGLMDTVPGNHAAGTVWMFARAQGRTSPTPYTTDLTVAFRGVTRNQWAELPLVDAPETSLTTASRALKPYPPGNVKLNGVGMGSWPRSVVGNATLSWSHRNRTQQGSTIVLQDAPSGTFTPEGTYTVEVLLGTSDVAVRQWTGLVGESQVYTWVERQADNPDTRLDVRFRLTPVNGALKGTVRVTPYFKMLQP